ncbi:astacin-like [Belonocnema kinseyi]|uniref:astacin-like n=1 Tax=Belonocnema kinseyi TaxID=2817044 RepID=UPI00143DC797|nr:astacin-like [Belonocnema kinseyi]
MFLLRMILFAIFLGICAGHPANRGKPIPPVLKSEVLLQKGYDRETIAKRLKAWKPEDKQNIWELSGLHEGDIILPAPGLANKNGLLNDNLRWTDGVVPYFLKEEDFEKEEIAVIMGAIKEYHNKTCLRFRPYKESDQDYVTVQGSDSGCWSSVGRQRKGQILNLQTPNCVRHGVAVHEFMHAIGFFHQHSAANRDNYVTIHWENIEPGRAHNFKKFDNDTVTEFGVEYDYGSVMHYSAFAFSKNDEPTIEPKMKHITIGQRRGLSDKDIAKVENMYKPHCEKRQAKEDESDYDLDLWFLD